MAETDVNRGFIRYYDLFRSKNSGPVLAAESLKMFESSSFSGELGKQVIIDDISIEKNMYAFITE